MTETELLAAIQADLDDDAPRLVYADWLSERGDPRGEFIQVQCKLEKQRTRVLEYKERRLLAEHQEYWLRNIQERARSVSVYVQVVRFRRGLPEELIGSGRVNYGLDRVLELAPTVRRLSFYLREPVGDDDLLPELEALLALRPWRALTIGPNLDDEGARVLARSRNLARLEALGLTRAGVGADGLRALAALPIRELTLIENGGRIDLSHIAGMTTLRRLVVEIQDLDIGTIAGPPLSSIRLDQCRFGPGAIEALARAYPVLEELALVACFVRDVEVASLPRAQKLSLADNDLGPEAAWALASRGELVELNLIENALGDEGARVFAASDALVNLRKLYLSRNGISKPVAEMLARSPRLASCEIWVDSDQPLRRIG
jgi:uncharacterized protein (TIGR02996 family)